MLNTKWIVMVTITALGASNALAAPITWTGASGMSVMNSPNAMSVMNATILAPQSSDLNRKESAKQAAAATASAIDQQSSEAYTANLISQQVQSNIAATISQNITNQNGAAPSSGVYNIGNSQTISYNRSGGNTNVIIQQLGKAPINLSFPTIQ